MWTPPVYSDARAAWTGSLAERPDIPMRIEAAAYRGKPVYFELIGPWTRPERMQPYPAARRSEQAVVSLLFCCFGAGRRRDACPTEPAPGPGRSPWGFSSGSFCFRGLVVAGFFGAHHVPTFANSALFIEFLVWRLAWSCFLWVLYIALEPYVRRRWPATLVSWSRLLAGGFRDPILVGRDVLAGCLSGVSSTAVGRLVWFVTVWLGYPPPQPESGPTWQLLADKSNHFNSIHRFDGCAGSSGLEVCFPWFFFDPCFARTGQRQSRSFS